MGKRKLASLAVASALGMAAVSAHANLVLLGPENFSGTGLGAVNTVLTITSPANSTTETGSVGVGPGGTQVTTGDVMTGASQTQVRSFSSLGITQASALRVVFNAVEPGNATS